MGLLRPFRPFGPLRQLAPLVLCALSTCLHIGLTHANQGAAFSEARQAYARADVKAIDAAANKLEGQALQVYPQYWSLSLALARTQLATGELAPSGLKQRVDRFLADHPESPLADQLRRDWLELLAKTGDWDAYRLLNTSVLGDDVEVQCYNWQERLLRNDTRALDDIKLFWSSEKESSPACGYAFDALVRDKRLSAEDVYARVRRSFSTGQASATRDGLRAAQYLPEGYKIDEAAVTRAQAEPRKYLTKGLALKNPSQVEVALLALTRLAKSDAADAANVLTQHMSGLSKTDAAYAWAVVGANAAQQHLAQADDWVAKGVIGESFPALTESLAGWAVRAALRAEQWPLVARTIRAMPEATRLSDNAWRYWLARALAMEGKKDESQNLYRELAGELGFYGWMAREEIVPMQVVETVHTMTKDKDGKDVPVTQSVGKTVPPPGLILNFAPSKPAATDLQRLRAQIGIQRAIALYRLGNRDDGFREWTWALRFIGKPSTTEPGKKLAPTDSDYVAAAELARSEGIPDRAIATALRTKTTHDFALRFPLNHLEQIKSAASNNQIEKSWIYGIIRQESRFMTDVRSRAGALGLMQIMPATGKWLAGKAKMSKHATSDLLDVDTNIALGSYYLRSLQDELGDKVMASAAYNAGPGRARRWRDDRPLEGAIYAETIPFNETRDYVKQVMLNMAYYEEQLTGKRMSIRQLMGTIPAKS
jgi:soluble lytic murein transglycosylase